MIKFIISELSAAQSGVLSLPGFSHQAISSLIILSTGLVISLMAGELAFSLVNFLSDLLFSIPLILAFFGFEFC